MISLLTHMLLTVAQNLTSILAEITIDAAAKPLPEKKHITSSVCYNELMFATDRLNELIRLSNR